MKYISDIQQYIRNIEYIQEKYSDIFGYKVYSHLFICGFGIFCQ